jgi:hypothetical protein
VTSTTTIAAVPFSDQELTELRKMGYRRTEDDTLLVHRACGETVHRGDACGHHDACGFVRTYNMGYTRSGDGFLHMPYACPTNDPDQHDTKCQARFHPRTH